MSRKAITPLISTILLLVFAIGLGTLVMSWGSSENFRPVSLCDHALLSITQIDSSNQVCLSGNTIRATLENNGNIAINKVQLVILTSNAVLTDEIEANIAPGEFKYLDIPSEISDNSKILKIRLIPYTDKESCISQRVELEKIGVCE